jgi:dihydroflavonol-4-reductase
MKTAIVTGATGFLGRNLVEVLLRENWSVTVLHRRNSDLKRLKGCEVKFQEVDLYDAQSVMRAIPESLDAIFHVAGNTSHWSKEAQVQWKDNVLATRNLVEAALAKKVKRFIFTSTGATNSYQNTNEAQAMKIKNSYVRTKRLSELEVYKGMERGLDAIIMKPIIIIGKYDFSSYSKIFQDMKNNSFRIALPGKIAFCYAGDVAQAHLRAFEKGRSFEHYVLGGAYATWFEFGSEIAKLLKVSNPTVIPKWVLFPLSYFMSAFSYVSGKAPLLSPDLAILLDDAADVTFCDAHRAQLDLGYTSRPLSEMVRICHDWMVEEKML